MPLGGAAATCLGVCASSSACRPGYACMALVVGGPRVCAPSCKADADCGQGLGCNTASGVCEVAPGGRVGARCKAGPDCASNLCLSETDSEGFFGGGYCSGACTAADAGKACAGGDGVCAPAAVRGTVQHLCLQPCGSGAPCRADQGCTAIGAAGAGFCYPRCQQTGCELGSTCDVSTGACVPSPGAGGPAPEVQRRDLGIIDVGSSSAGLGAFAVEVPASAVSMTVVVEPLAAGIAIVPVRITTPDGKVVHDEANPSRREYRTIPPFNTRTLAMQFPNTPRLGLLPGSYQFVVAATTATTQARVNVVFKLQAAAPQAGSLPIHLWFTRQPYLNAQTAQTDRRFARAIFELSNRFGAANIRLGPVSYRDLTGPEATALAVIDSREEAARLFAQAGDTHGPALHVFLVDQIVFPGGMVAGGTSSAIPGVPSVPGLTPGGVAVALSGLDSLGFSGIMAHEAGHALGLFHTTEKDGQLHDPLADTPECPIGADANRDATLDFMECAAFGADNLMFWTVYALSPGLLTPDQRFVMLRNASVQ